MFQFLDCNENGEAKQSLFLLRQPVLLIRVAAPVTAPACVSVAATGQPVIVWVKKDQTDLTCFCVALHENSTISSKEKTTKKKDRLNVNIKLSDSVSQGVLCLPETCEAFQTFHVKTHYASCLLRKRKHIHPFVKFVLASFELLFLAWYIAQ